MRIRASLVMLSPIVLARLVPHTDRAQVILLLEHTSENFEHIFNIASLTLNCSSLNPVISMMRWRGLCENARRAHSCGCMFVFLATEAHCMKERFKVSDSMILR